jgi:hypothetical protein
LHFLGKKRDTELEKASGSFWVEQRSSSALVFGDTIASARRHRFWIFVSTSSRIVVLDFDGSGAVKHGKLLPHGVGGSFVNFEVVVFVGSGHLQRIQRDMSSLR